MDHLVDREAYFAWVLTPTALIFWAYINRVLRTIFFKILKIFSTSFLVPIELSSTSFLTSFRASYPYQKRVFKSASLEFSK